MPELPEVENVCRGLAEFFKVHSQIESVLVQSPKLRYPIPKKVKELKAVSVKRVHRRAKYIVIDLGSVCILNHLGMTGSWRIATCSSEIKHDHLALKMGPKTFLVYNDPRRFGYISIVDVNEVQKCRWFKHLGVEPLSADFTASYLFKIARHKKQPIKALLMDQKNVVGIGNIYAAEALFLAKVKPTRVSHKLKFLECEAIVTAVKEVLDQSIQSGGTTIKDYRTVYGDVGGFVTQLNVYGRYKEPCRACKNLIRKKVIAGRSTFWCSKCQR
jgi:formamidopyrimidine-DNA glycosylase